LMNKDLIITGDQRSFECTLWEKSDFNKVLIVAPAMGVSRHFYSSISEYFHGLNYNVLSFDYFGMVHSRDKSENSSIRLSDWGYLDLKAVIHYTSRHFPGQDLFLIGHSIVGQVLPLAPNKNVLKAAFLVASQNLIEV